MEEKNYRKAQFRTIISLIEKGEERQFEGIVKGQITREKRGESGFGYDPIFQPDGYEPHSPNWVATSRTASATVHVQ